MTIDEAEKIKTVVENKDYIVQLVNTIAKTLIEAFENLKIEDVNMFQLGYNKAIDDFAEKLKEMANNSSTKYIRLSEKETIVTYGVEQIVKQLKAGGKNE